MSPFLVHLLRRLIIKLTNSDDNVENVERSSFENEISELSVIAEGEDTTTWFVWLLVLCTSISGLLFGMEGHSLDESWAYVSNP